MKSRFDAIAVVGLSCRFPKDLDSLSTLWEAMKKKYNAIDRVPKERWDADRYYSSNELSKGKTYIQRGGFLSQDVMTFDAAFFGISPREAENMDPQQRLLLEVVWEAFENGGLRMTDYAGRQVGVYVGGFMLDHMITQMSSSNRSQINQHSAAGMMMTMLSNRISHTFDFRGPSLSIDTACSSSLVAFHYACQDIWHGVSDLAVVGGANVMMRPEYPMGMSKGHFLSRDGESKSFDERGDGYGRGEGASVVLLKPLAKAVSDGDTILACVRGTGTNQDGNTSGISMPSSEAQQRLMRDVCQSYAIDPRDVRYVECHGTGTAIGDPTECEAIGAVYGSQRHGQDPVVIGSIKSNIGHLEAGAGVAGVVKAIGTLLNRQSAPLANLQQPNPAIPFDEWGLRLSDEVIPLGSGTEPFCVAVNSFGYGGSNAHVVLESAAISSHENRTPSKHKTRPELVETFPFLLPLSARSKEALTAMAVSYREVLQDNVDVQDVLYSASMHRDHLSYRAVVMGADRASLIQGLESLANGEVSEQVVHGSQPYQGIRKPVFVFSGMGPQWWGMGQELYRYVATYRDAVEQADALFQEISGFSILDEMLKEEGDSRISETQYAQPANLILQIGLLAILNRAGVVPAAVVGHSVGELGSAYAAGVLSLSDVLKVSYHRSQLQATTAGTGGMLAVGVGKEAAMEKIADCADRVSIAAVNGTQTVTLAGDVDQLDRLATKFTEADIFNRKLDVEVPYHSPLMDPLMPKLSKALAEIETAQPSVPIYSTVTGQQVTDASYDAEYWSQNIRQPVEFASAMQVLLNDGYNAFFEIGAHPVLSAAIRDCIQAAGKEGRLVHTLRRHQPECQNMHHAVVNLFVAGCDIDWQAHNGSGKFIPLPNYPWQRQSLWLENERAIQDRINPIVNPILGTQEAFSAPVWRNDFDHESLAYLRDHIVSGMPVLAAAAYIESIFEFSRIQFPESNGTIIRNLDIMAPMIIAPDRGLDFTTSFEDSSQAVSIRSLENGRLGTGQIHVTAKIAELKTSQSFQQDLQSLLTEFDTQADLPAFYRDLGRIGLNYGPLFQTVRELRTQVEKDRVLARVEIDASLTGNLEQYCLHPTILDGCFQTLMAMLDTTDTTYLPNHLGELCLYAERLPESIWCLGEKISQDQRSVICNLTLMDDQGTILGVVRSLRASAASRSERTDSYGDKVKRQILDYRWSHGETLAEPRRLGHWLVVGDDNDVADPLVRCMENYGACIVGHARFGDQYCQEGNRFTLLPGSVDSASRMLEACGDIDGVVFLNGIDGSADQKDPTGEQALCEMIAVMQAMSTIEPGNRPRVYLLTQSAFVADPYDSIVRPGQATLNGFARVAANELEGFRFSTIDLVDPLNEQAVESLTLELLCDAAEDEVALRGPLRLVSELAETDVLSKDRILETSFDDQHPIRIRPLRPNSESVGTVRVLATTVPEVCPDEIFVRVEQSLLPMNLIADQSSEHIDQSCIEMVGTVLKVGSAVTDLKAGSRICGFAPIELASHVCAKRCDFQVAEITEGADASTLVSEIGLLTRAERAVECLKLDPDNVALLHISPMSRVIAESLERQGIRVVMLSDDMTSLDQQLIDRYPVYAMDPESLERAIVEQTDRKGFQLLIAGMHDWMKRFDLRAIAKGGTVVDTDPSAHALELPGHVDCVVRTDMSILLQRPKQLESALHRAVDQITGSEYQKPALLEVSVADIALQNLPLQQTQTHVVLSYACLGEVLPMVQSDDLSFNPNATYLITGGFGGFGRKTAWWLVNNGAKHLVLTGRVGAETPERQAFVDELEGQGVSVHAAACDTASLDQLKELFNRMDSDMPPLKGVFHTAAVIKDQSIAEMDLASVTMVMRNKSLGAWNLHLLTQNLELDHFVLYSSLANLIGNSRQGAYCAANGFLNGLAQMRKLENLPGTSVNWGAISDVGVVAQDEKLEQFLKYLGLRGLASVEGLDLLRQSLVRNVTQFGVVVLTSWADWARFETLGAKSPRFEKLIQADLAPKDTTLRDQLVAAMEELSSADQIDLVADLIREMVATVLKSAPENVSIDRPFSELGVDSLMATEIQLQFDSRLGFSVSVLALLGDATIRSLALEVVDSLNADSSHATPVAPSQQHLVSM